MKDEVEKLNLRRQIIEIVYEDSFHLSNSEKVDKLLKLFQTAQVEAVRAAIEQAKTEVGKYSIHRPKGQPKGTLARRNLMNRLDRLASLKENGETK